MGSLAAACKLLVAACGIQFPKQGSNLGPLHWEHGVLSTVPPGKSRLFIIKCKAPQSFLEAVYIGRVCELVALPLGWPCHNLVILLEGWKMWISMRLFSWVRRFPQEKFSSILLGGLQGRVKSHCQHSGTYVRQGQWASSYLTPISNAVVWNVGDTGSIPGPGRPHMPWSN